MFLTAKVQTPLLSNRVVPHDFNQWGPPTCLSTKTASSAHWPRRQAATGWKCRSHQTSVESLVLSRRFFHGSTDHVFRHSTSSPHLSGQTAETMEGWMRVLVPPRVPRLACHGLTHYKGPTVWNSGYPHSNTRTSNHQQDCSPRHLRGTHSSKVHVYLRFKQMRPRDYLSDRPVGRPFSTIRKVRLKLGKGVLTGRHSFWKDLRHQSIV